jgi:lysophospholipase L1-like esterase
MTMRAPKPSLALTVPLLALLATPALAQDRWAERVALFERENAQLDPAKEHVVLFGSSSMEGWRYSNRVRNYLPTVGERALNRGISGDGIGITVPGKKGLRNRLPSAVWDTNPSHVFILNGRNSLGYGPTKVAAAYRALIEEIQARDPDVVVGIVTCPPVRGRYAHMKDKVVQLNAKLRVIARELGCELIELHPRLVGSDGLMKAELTSDGLHMKNAGYRILGAEIERIVAETEAAAEQAGGSGSAAEAGRGARRASDAAPRPRCRPSRGASSLLDGL